LAGEASNGDGFLDVVCPAIPIDALRKDVHDFFRATYFLPAFAGAFFLLRGFAVDGAVTRYLMVLLGVVLPSAFPVSRRTVYISSLQSGHFHGPFHVPNPDKVSFVGLKVLFVFEFLHFAFVQRAPTIIGASYVFSPALCRSSVMMPR
jgi:hypothetical protein